ncbi:MAG: phosphopantothenoylcysteine decarboxylase [Clostridiales Family XIII bacterium]|jgi:phosphopantothenoylcysteine synthetase/decarboxylase|nr:phosphopantothenoylcysteine decarboxylase [Clostridiales Family XIII bacterium]
MARILLGVTGGIAAYKAVDIASLLARGGHAVDVVMTKNAREFITPLPFQTLLRAPVYTDSFEPIEDFSVEHISLAKRADLVLVAPATANFIGKLTAGIADDLLLTVALAAWEKPHIICPAMNSAMLANPVVQENIEKLRERGYMVADSESGRLACGDEGLGRLLPPEKIAGLVEDILGEN